MRLENRRMNGIRIEKENNERLRITFPYNAGYIAKIRVLRDISGILRKSTGVFLTPIMFSKEF